VPRKSGSWLGGIKKEILELYPDMTGELLARCFEWKKPYTPKNVALIIGMIGDYQNEVHRPVPVTVIPARTEDVFGSADDFIPLKNGVYAGGAAA